MKHVCLLCPPIVNTDSMLRYNIHIYVNLLLSECHPSVDFHNDRKVFEGQVLRHWNEHGIRKCIRINLDVHRCCHCSTGAILIV